MKKTKALIAGGIYILLAMPVMAGSLSGDEIKNVFSGKTATGDHLKKGLVVRSFHASDGSYKSYCLMAVSGLENGGSTLTRSV